MTHHHQTNGASLEDCHTNFFALTELCGIKWRKLVWGETGGGGGDGDEDSAPLEDPVISSYARCLAGDILCVWRRVSAPPPPNADPYDMSAPPPPPPPPLSLRAAKELWIFWYGEEPDLNGLVAPELISCQGDSGSWEGGLSYECRSLLFKALHNLIERCLLSRDFVRLGKWFVQPYDGDEEDVGKSAWHLSFSFAFFVHGESTVCASVDVRQHPAVRTLTPARLAHAARRPHPNHHNNMAKVILAPFGLEGVLTGASWTESDAPTARLHGAWRQLYPLEDNATAVEVLTGGVRLRYPASYVLLTDMDPPRGAASPAPAPHPPSAHLPRTPAATMAERTVRALTTADPPDKIMELYNGEVPDKMDVDFLDPTRKTPCTCSKRRGAARGNAGRTSRRHQPFHRRPRYRPPVAAHLAAGMCSPGSCGGGSPAAPHSAPPSAGPAPTSPSQLTVAAHQLGGTLHTPAPTPDPHAPPTPVPASAPTTRQHYTQSSPADTKALGGSGSALVFGGGGGGGAVDGPILPEELLKPPVLAADEPPEPLDDEHTLHMLYDYSCVRAWLEHPVKRFKSEDSGFREELTQAKGFGTNTELYRGHDHIEMATVPDRRRTFNDDVKQEPDDIKNLYTLDGLFPSNQPPDQIFDNSDDAASGDEALQIQTPPDSNKSSGEETRVGSGARCVRAEELSKMFPTPPSAEAHLQASPGAFTLNDDHTATHLSTRLHAPSPSPDPIEDWSYVFKPPTMCKYVGSSKYAPLTNLPSQQLPPIILSAAAVYKPRWQQEKEGASVGCGGGGVKRCASPIAAVHSAGTISAPASVGCPGSAGAVSQGIGASPALRPPPPYALSPPSPASPPASPRAHACSLLLNTLLSDTVLNIFRDHNFDSCTLCVCNASPKVVGNIRGADCNTYLTGAPQSPGESPSGSPNPQYDDDPIRCSCGFSAVVNRRLAHRAGLFYEDEMEITGMASDPAATARSSGRGLHEVSEMVLSQCAAFGGAASALARAAHEAASTRLPDDSRMNELEYTDGGEAAALALRAAAGNTTSPNTTVHRWPFIGARGPRSSRDVLRLMKRLRPALQDAIQKRGIGTRMWDGVSGPLTWRQFHRLCGRGTEDPCEPQPVPTLLVGHDRDWLSVSPYALRHWERLALEPYSYNRDVAYVVLAPEGEALAEPLRIFFRELSTVYESCRLGRHAPLWRIAKDGVVRASVTPDRDRGEDWVGEVPPGRLGECIRAYAETLRTVLVPQLANVSLDRTLFEPDGVNKNYNSVERPSPSPMRPPSTPDHPHTPSSQSDQEGESGGNGGTGTPSNITGPSPAPWETEEEGGAPALVLYVVEPPRAAAHASQALHALLRLASRVSTHLQHHNLTVKIISLEGVCEAWGLSGGARTELRALAFSVFTCTRRLLSHTPHINSLTGFGTAADAQLFLKNKDEKNRAPYRLYSPAYVLAPSKAVKDVADSFGQLSVTDQCSVLYLSYCLSQDQSTLLAVATDARGELLETTAINIHVPGLGQRRRAAPARRLGLTKLMDFILGVMSQSAQPWRLVVGRIGRIGHGELKGWSWLLSRKNLVRASGMLREICSSCAIIYPPGQSTAPCILSACLVSTEPDSCLRLMADRFTPDERFSQAAVASHLHTPRDVTATHILVFPTSATTQSSQTAFQEQHINGNENDDILFPVLPDNEEMDGDMGDMGGINDMFDDNLFNNMWNATSPSGAVETGDGDGNGSRDGSPSNGAPGRQTNADYGQSDDPAAEQVGTVLQQPLALGYLVSTAPLGSMPAWWWAGCAHLRDACPAFLKNALHLHSPAVQQSSDDMLQTMRHDQHHHPLDSHITTDVLRYVLEGYNALSWLALDGNTHDRLSCLPLHVQVLMQLYHATLALS